MMIIPHSTAAGTGMQKYSPAKDYFARPAENKLDWIFYLHHEIEIFKEIG